MFAEDDEIDMSKNLSLLTTPAIKAATFAVVEFPVHLRSAKLYVTVSLFELGDKMSWFWGAIKFPALI